MLNVSANKPCNYVLTLENGAMKNEETFQVFEPIPPMFISSRSLASWSTP